MIGRSNQCDFIKDKEAIQNLSHFVLSLTMRRL